MSAAPDGHGSGAAPKLGAIAGFMLAFDLYDELLDVGLNRCSLDDGAREGQPQDVVFLRYLDRLRALNDRDAEIAFSRLMTERLCSSFEGSCMDADHEASLVGLEEEYWARYAEAHS